MKKRLFGIIMAVLMTASLAGCGQKAGNGAAGSSGDGKLQIVTTIFPEYDWVMNILGDDKKSAEVTLLLDNGVDLHSYQPTADDIITISTCDLFIYVGGESDAWVDDALAEAVNKDMVVINLLDTIGDDAKEEELVEGMQGEEEEEEEEDEEEGPEYDEHVWLSLKNAEKITERISLALQEIDPENADLYSENSSDYIEKLASLDKEYEEMVAGSTNDTILFGDRFPFRYLTDDYDLNYYAAFIGCSAESEASFETITFLAGKVDELGLKTVLIIDGSDGKIAETIISNTSGKDQQILTLNSMQSVTGKDIENGMTYLSIMKDNLTVLTQALD